MSDSKPKHFTALVPQAISSAQARVKTPAEPFLRWAGSKRRLIGRLCAEVPASFKRYVEPFAGSACFFFYLKPPRALLTDFNRDLVHAFSIVAKHPRLLSQRLSCFAADAAEYYRVRELIKTSSDALERAAYFIYLNSYCFNGVYRTNRNGDFNVPRGTKSRGVPSASLLWSCSMALRNIEIRCQDYRETLKHCTDGDFVYLDPPYAAPAVRYRGEYGIGSFQQEDESKLLDELLALDSRGVKFLLSYRDSKRFVETISKSWHVTRVRVNRSVSGFAESRRSVFEVLIRNYELTSTVGADS